MSQPSPGETTAPSRLSVEILALANHSSATAIALGELIERLEGRVYTLLLVVLAVPFCQPIALPGLSTPFGVLIALLGLRFAVRQRPWIPRRLLRTQLPARFVPMALRGAARLLAAIEKCLRPCFGACFEFHAIQFGAGFVIFICGLLLLLPLPVPFSNLLPALTVVLVAAAVAERDAVVLAAGGVVFLLTLGFFALIFLGGVEVVQWLEERFGGVFDPDDEAPGVAPTTR